MSQEIPPKFEKAQLQLLNSEIDKNKAETKKHEVEIQEVKERIKQRFSARKYVQAIIGGVVAAGLLATWIIGYLSPVLKKEMEIAKLENNLLKVINLREAHLNDSIRIKNEEQAFSNQLTTKMLDSANLVFENEKREMQKKLYEISAYNDQILADYKKLQESTNLTRQEKQYFENRSKVIQSQKDSIVKTFNSVSSHQNFNSYPYTELSKDFYNSRWEMVLMYDSTLDKNGNLVPRDTIVLEFYENDLLVEKALVKGRGILSKPKVTEINHKWYISENILYIVLLKGLYTRPQIYSSALLKKRNQNEISGMFIESYSNFDVEIFPWRARKLGDI